MELGLIISQNEGKRQVYSSGVFVVVRIGLRSCAYCHHSSHVYLSRVKTFWDLVAMIFMLRPVRCHACLGRFYRPFFLNTPPPPPIKMKATELPDDEDGQRSA
jgi:hypothetical protein